MKDAEGKEIISGKIYRDFGATLLDFDSAYSGIYLVRQLPSGLVVAKDEKGVSRRVWSNEEISEMYEKGLNVCIKKVHATGLYLCNEQDILILQNKLERSRKRTPGLISLLNNFAQSQPKCTDEGVEYVSPHIDPSLFPHIDSNSSPHINPTSFPHIDPNSPNYNPHKQGGDNPHPCMRC